MSVCSSEHPIPPLLPWPLLEACFWEENTFGEGKECLVKEEITFGEGDIW